MIRLAIGGAGWVECRIDCESRRPHWQALAAMAVFFTRKSHAAVIRARNAMIRNS